MPDVTPEQIELMCRQLTEFLPEGHGFIIFTFPTGDAPDRRIRYASNVKRTDAVNAIKEWMIQRGLDEDWMRHDNTVPLEDRIKLSIAEFWHWYTTYGDSGPDPAYVPSAETMRNEAFERYRNDANFHRMVRSLTAHIMTTIEYPR